MANPAIAPYCRRVSPDPEAGIQLSVPPLAEREVHAWFASLALPAPQLPEYLATLSEEERARAHTFRAELPRTRFIASRYWLRHLIAAYDQVSPSQIAFDYGEHGKPTLRNSNLQFNLSHSGDDWLVAFARNAVLGVDIERPRSIHDAASLVKRFFSPNERAHYEALPPDQQHDAFFRGWTRKEAFIKATGKGLAFPLDQFSVEIRPLATPALLDIQGSTDAAKAWSLFDLSPAPGLHAALVIQGSPWTVQRTDVPAGRPR